MNQCPSESSLKTAKLKHPSCYFASRSSHSSSDTNTNKTPAFVMPLQPEDEKPSRAFEQDANVASNDALQPFPKGDDDKVEFSPFCELALKVDSLK